MSFILFKLRVPSAELQAGGGESSATGQLEERSRQHD